MTIHVVSSGETVYSISRQYAVSTDSIIYNNQLTYPYTLAIGQALLISTYTESSPTQAVVTNGFAYPFIQEYVLYNTLPFLTRLSVFSYGFTSEGYLIPPQIDDEPLIQATINNGSAPFLTLTPFGPDGKFNNTLITQVINNPAAIEQLIEELIYVINTRGFQGVDIDFEYILASDRIAFASFVREVREAVNLLGYPVTVDLAPKTSDDQAGLLYEGKDYALLGEAANEVLLMTYEWGYTYSEPMAVAPIPNVRRVVEYALTRIPAEKINLGIPNYGYDWPLPYEKGITAATTIGNVEAVRLAVENNVPIQFDERSMSPYFQYTKNGVMHEVWFEDVRSMQAKFQIVKDYGLHGMGYWQIMRLFRANWLLLADQFYIL